MTGVSSNRQPFGQSEGDVVVRIEWPKTWRQLLGPLTSGHPSGVRLPATDGQRPGIPTDRKLTRALQDVHAEWREKKDSGAALIRRAPNPDEGCFSTAG